MRDTNDLKIIYEDRDILVVDKPAGVTVNKSETTRSEETIQDWSEKKFKADNLELRIEQDDFYNRGGVPPAMQDVDPRRDQQKSSLRKFSDPVRDFALRAGVVHRLDKETSGVLILAKNPEAFSDLQRQFKERLVKKIYKALVHGRLIPNTGEISVPVGRLPWNRRQFGIVPGGRASVTFYKVIGYYRERGEKELYSYVEVSPKTGRTHQIRVHLKYQGFPIFADFLYAGRKVAKKDRKKLNRVFLHAAKISFSHPKSGEEVSFESQLPADLATTLDGLEKVGDL